MKASRLLVVLFSLGYVQAEDIGTTSLAWAQALSFPPALPNGKSMVTITSPKLLEPRNELRENVAVATTPPRVDFLYYPGQEHPPKRYWRTRSGGRVLGQFGANAPAHMAKIQPELARCRCARW